MAMERGPVALERERQAALLRHMLEELRAQQALIRDGRLDELLSSLEKVGSIIAELEVGTGRPCNSAQVHEANSDHQPEDSGQSDLGELRGLAVDVVKLYASNRAALERERARIAAELQTQRAHLRATRSYLGGPGAE